MTKTNPVAKALANRALHQRKVKPRKGRGSYTRKNQKIPDVPAWSRIEPPPG